MFFSLKDGTTVAACSTILLIRNRAPERVNLCKRQTQSDLFI